MGEREGEMTTPPSLPHSENQRTIHAPIPDTQRTFCGGPASGVGGYGVSGRSKGSGQATRSTPATGGPQRAGPKAATYSTVTRWSAGREGGAVASDGRADGCPDGAEVVVVVMSLVAVAAVGRAASGTRKSASMEMVAARRMAAAAAAAAAAERAGGARASGVV